MLFFWTLSGKYVSHKRKRFMYKRSMVPLPGPAPNIYSPVSTLGSGIAIFSQTGIYKLPLELDTPTLTQCRVTGSKQRGVSLQDTRTSEKCFRGLGTHPSPFPFLLLAVPGAATLGKRLNGLKGGCILDDHAAARAPGLPPSTWGRNRILSS